MTNQTTRALHLHDLFDPTALTAEVDAGYVRTQRHPQRDLIIYNYTQQAQYARRWNDITLACRGLVTDGAGHVLARPWRKFFNHHEHPHQTLPADDTIQVLDKLDGSLGILVPVGDGRYEVTTRGSFISEQAVHATSTWQRRYEPVADLDPRLTYLVEIVYPTNRIVVDYGLTDDLVLLGAVDTATGASVDVLDVRGWPGPRVEVFDHANLASVLAAPPRPNAEGFVVWFRTADVRVKIKQSDYLRLHKLVTGVSERRIWEALSAGDSLDDWLENVPDEFYDFVTTTAATLRHDFATLQAQSRAQYDSLVAGLGHGWTRKDFAMAVAAMTCPLKSVMFAYLDNKSADARLWAELRPAEHQPAFAKRADAS